MSIQEFLDDMKKIQKNLIDFLDSEEKSEEKSERINNFTKLINDLQILDDQNKFRSVLHIIVQLANDHHRCSDFFDKIDQILQIFSQHIKSSFSNIEIFNIFASNKRVLLFLIEQGIFTIDHYFVRKITIDKKFQICDYPLYFQPEIQPFMKEEWFPIRNHQWIPYKDIFYEELPENFYENRKSGENDKKICQLIKNDQIDEFIVYINKENISVDSIVNRSIFETNSLFYRIILDLYNKHIPAEEKRGVPLINYAAFYGSVNIFNYLKMNNTRLTPLLWTFAIHGQNAQIIQTVSEEVRPVIKKFNYHMMDDQEIETFVVCIEESIKCHHDNITDYILNNHMENEEISPNELFNFGLKYYNFEYIKSEQINESAFFNLCKYDHCKLVDILMKNADFDLNKLIKIFINCF